MMKMNKVTTRKAWGDTEVRRVLDLYDFFLICQRTNTKYTKAGSVRELAAKLERSKGSIEAKMMNVSAVLVLLGKPYVTGYKPLSNYNKDLVNQVGQWFGRLAA